MKEREGNHPLSPDTCLSKEGIGGSYNHLSYELRGPLPLPKNHTTVDKRIGRAFLTAAKEGDVLIIEQCLAQGVNPNLRSQEKETALHLAVKHNQAAVVHLLILNGASYKLKNADGFTVRDIALDKMEVSLEGAISKFKQHCFDQRIEHHPLVLQLKAEVATQQKLIGTLQQMNQSHFFSAGEKVKYSDAAAQDQKQNLFVNACAQGDIPKMHMFITEGVSLSTPSDTKRYPLLACIESLNMEAIHYLTDHIKREGSDAWSIVDLSALEVTLNKMRPQPLKKSAGEAPDRHSTWADVYKSHQANQVRCKVAYESKYGAGTYQQGTELAKRRGIIKGTQLCYCRRGRMLLETATRMEFVIQSVNEKIDNVISYVQEQVATISLFKPGT